MTDKTSWNEIADKELRGKSLETLTWDTLEGIKVQPLYTAQDVKGLAHIGSVPGTRTLHAWCQSYHVCGSTLDYSAICWIFHS